METNQQAETGATYATPVAPKDPCKWCGGSIEYRYKDGYREVIALSARLGFPVSARMIYEPIGHFECLEAQDAANKEAEELERLNKVKERRGEEIARWYQNQALPTTAATKTFANFDHDEKSLAAFRALKHWKSGDDFGFLLSGPAGTGKSHLCFALVNRLIDEVKNSPVTPEEGAGWIRNLELPVYYSVSELLAGMRANHGSSEFPRGLLDSKFLFLDDLGTESLTDWSRDILFRLFDHRLNHRLPTLITTNLTLNELKDRLFERVTSRILALCIPLTIDGRDRRRDILAERAAILKARVMGGA